jgi:hypothetical protein
MPPWPAPRLIVQQTGTIMANIRTANKRHKRTIVVKLERAKAAAPAAAPTTAKPAKAAA